MKAAFYKGIREFEVKDVPYQEPGEGQALLRIDYCSVCGSDLHGYTHGLWTAPGVIMGHEYAGTIEKVGPNFQSDINVGDRVTVCGLTPCGVCDKCVKGFYHLCPNMRGAQGAYAEYTTPASPGVLKMFFKLPDNVSTLEGSMIEPLSVGLHAAKLAKYNMNETIVVLGAGTIGLMTSQCVKAMCGASKVIQVDISAKRLEMAKELGIDYVINAAEVDDLYAEIEKITGPCKNPYGHPGLVDIVFECAGIPTTVNQAQQLAKGGGQIISVAITEVKHEIDLNALVQKEITWKGSYAYIHEYAESIAMLSAGKVKVKPLVTDIFKIDDIHAAFDKQLDTKNSIKVVLDCR